VGISNVCKPATLFKTFYDTKFAKDYTDIKIQNGMVPP
jgi:hypothetical protein